MQKIFVFAALFLAIMAFSFVYITVNRTKPAPIQPQQDNTYKAAAAIFINGAPLDLSTAPYTNASPDMYFSSSEPNSIYLSKQATWAEFFQTLPLQITPTCLKIATNETYCIKETVSLHFFLNGTENPQALQQSIKNGDKLLITYGLLTQKDIQQQLLLVPDIGK